MAIHTLPTVTDHSRVLELLRATALVELLLDLDLATFTAALEAFDGDNFALLDELDRRAEIIRTEILSAPTLQ